MVKFLKIRKVKSPQRAHGDAGFDVFVPEATEEFVKDFKAKNPDIEILAGAIIIPPQKAVNIPLGLKTSFPPCIALEANNKSGVATKKMLIYGASVVDSSYQGEIHAHLINVGQKEQILQSGDKILQFIPRYIDTDEHEVFDISDTTESEFYGGVVTARGDKGFGEGTGTR